MRNRSFRCVIATSAAMLLGGCAGLTVTPLDAETAAGLFTNGNSRSGYLVYEPIVAIPITANEKGECVVGKPIALKDPRRPYLVDIRSGLGKTAVDVTITDGWQLATIKDESDNSGLLAFLASAAGIAKNLPPAPGAGGAAPACALVGLHHVVPDGPRGVKLERITGP